jgi:hypothetical protein
MVVAGRVNNQANPIVKPNWNTVKRKKLHVFGRDFPFAGFNLGQT